MSRDMYHVFHCLKTFHSTALLICFYISFMQDDDNEGIQVSNEMANRMSLFYAYPTPLLKTLSDATSKFVTEVIKFCLMLFA